MKINNMDEDLGNVDEIKMDYISEYETRLIYVKPWRNPPVKSFLNNLYYRNWVGGVKEGYRNFFNYEQDRMTVAQAKKYFDWEFFEYAHYSALRLFPSWVSNSYWGESKGERELLFRNVIRDAMPVILDKLGIEMNWIAAVNGSRHEMAGIIVTSKIILTKKVKSEFFEQKKATLATMHDYKYIPKNTKRKRKKTKKRVILDCKKLAEAKEKIETFTILEKCFPYDFTVHWKTSPDNMSVVERILTKSFYLNILKLEDREYKIDRLIEFARENSVEIPIEYYSHRYLDDQGNLLTNHEIEMLELEKEAKNWMRSTKN